MTSKPQPSLPDRLPPGLYIVATPIGNLGDISPRAADTLRRSDLVLVEDSRVTATLLRHIGCERPMTAYHDHNADAVRPGIVARLGGEAVALVSDAGTPLISDPGFKLVRDARAAGHFVTTVAGPCAAIAALTVSGLPSDRFLFAGFLPSKARALADAIAELKPVRATLILYESPHRTAATLAALAEGLGDRQAAVARELSKRFEEVATGSLSELAARYGETAPRGEVVLVVGPPEAPPPADAEALDAALAGALAGNSVSRAAAEVAAALGLPKRDVYARALELAKS